MNAGIATLLLGAILVDSANFDMSVARSQPRDFAAADALKTKGLVHFSSIEQLYNETQHAKADISSLTTTDLLRKDYKEWTSGSYLYGMSSVLVPFAEVVKRDAAALNAIRKFFARQKLSIFFVLSAFHRDGVFCRELAVYTPSTELLEFVCNGCKEGLKLEPLPFAADVAPECWRVFVQGATSSSRKAVQPLVGSTLAKY